MSSGRGNELFYINGFSDCVNFFKWQNLYKTVAGNLPNPFHTPGLLNQA